MAIVAIGGHSRNVGKTSVVAGLIAKLPAYNWTAFKLTQFGHGRCSLNGKPCQCETADHAWAITEEKDRAGKSDSSRFLVAGAKHAFWVRTAQGKLEKAMPGIRRRLDEAENAILESNSIMKFIQPDVYISVVDPANEDFKSSAYQFLGRADAIILHRSNGHEAKWPGISLDTLPDRPVFLVEPPEYVSTEVVEFVERRLEAARLTRVP
ncbi:MAG: hypothetical protein DMG92_13965 [Acidobacteria bacterium]|nr:MAG: hypothetical protein DMG92_13965 [Acidobacteriota bacterium]